MGTKNGLFFPLIVLSIYLISIIGIGRYSCHCDHASKISVLGIKSKCSCVEEVHKDDPGHHCVCGAHLETKEPRRDDCCSLKYFLLSTDQESHNGSYTILINDSPVIQPLEMQKGCLLSVIPPKIKTFQALFHRVTDSLFEKNVQLIL
ncbi:MAG: hypothetical protein ABFC28_04480 [Rikenellaceae bacterium]